MASFFLFFQNIFMRHIHSHTWAVEYHLYVFVRRNSDFQETVAKSDAQCLADVQQLVRVSRKHANFDGLLMKTNEISCNWTRLLLSLIDWHKIMYRMWQRSTAVAVTCNEPNNQKRVSGWGKRGKEWAEENKSTAFRFIFFIHILLCTEFQIDRSFFEFEAKIGFDWHVLLFSLKISNVCALCAVSWALSRFSSIWFGFSFIEWIDWDTKHFE